MAEAQAVEGTGAGRRTASSIRSRSDGSRSTASTAEARMRMWTRRFSVAWNGSAIGDAGLERERGGGLAVDLADQHAAGQRLGGVEGGQVAERGGVLFGGEADDVEVGGEQWSLLVGGC